MWNGDLSFVPRYIGLLEIQTALVGIGHYLPFPASTPWP